jgi:hypothetical protein
MVKFLAGISSIYIVLLWIVGLLLHLWTVWINFQIAGIIGGALALFFPVLSEIYTTYKAWSIGGFNAIYVVCTLGYLLLWGIQFALSFIVSIIEEKSNNHNF